MAQNWHFWSIWARPCRLIRVGWSVDGCGARAVSRKTPIYFILLLSSLPYCSGEKEPLRAAANRRRGRCEASHLSTNQRQGRCQPCHLSSWPIGAVDQLLLLLLGTNAVVLTKVCDHLCPCALVQPSVCQSVHTSSIYPFIHHSSIRLWVVFKF